MLTKVRITSMLTILGKYHIDSLDEFNHADPDDYGSMYQALGHLYKVSETITDVPALDAGFHISLAGVSQVGRIAAHVARDLTSDPSTVQGIRSLLAIGNTIKKTPAPVVQWVTSAEYAGLVSRIVEMNQRGADISISDALKNVRIKWETNNDPAF